MSSQNLQTTQLTQTISNNSQIAPDTSSCTIQPTSDHQLNANLAQFTKLLINALKDGTIPVKNSERLQNLTINDIVELVKKSLPNSSINNYINPAGTNIIEHVDSYNIIKDTKFAVSDFIPFKVITRQEPDLNDPLGIAKIDVPYIQATLPYDLLNKDRIVQIYITTKNDINDNLIQNEVLFEYDIQIDVTDPRAPYKIEARAKKIQIGKTQEYNVNTYPQEPTLWGTWSTEKYIKVTYLVDSNWVSIPNPNLPNITTPNVAVMNQAKAIPMNYGLSNLSFNDKPTEALDVSFKPTRSVTNLIDNILNLENKEANIISSPTWILVEDPALAKEFNSYINWFKTASKVLNQETFNFNWSPEPKNNITELVNVFIAPANKVINQFTFNLMAEKFIKLGKSLGLTGNASYIIEQIINVNSDKPIEINYTSKLLDYNSITNNETIYSLFLKLNKGEQYPFNSFEVSYFPARVTSLISSNSIADYYTQTLNTPTRIIEELIGTLLPISSQTDHINIIPIPTRIINFLEALTMEINRNYKLNSTAAKIIEIDQNNGKNFIGKTIVNSNTSATSPYFAYINKQSSKIAIMDDLINGASKLNYFSSFNLKNINTSKSNRVIQQSKYIPNNILGEEILFNAESNIDFIPDEFNLFGNSLDDIRVFTNGNPRIQTGINFKKLFIFNPARIINIETTTPIKMEVSSGSLYYIQDLYNMKVVSSLNKEELVPLITSEGRQQRSEYEFVAIQDQRVFDVKHNPDLVTVFRQGFKLSHGDYYSNGYKIILKSPTNAGEIINIVSEKRYVFSNTVTKEELDNALLQFKTDKPIITYQGVAYEKTTANITIHNYDPNAYYNVSINFGGYRDDIVWTKKGNIIQVDLPEIEKVSRRTISIVIYAHTSGKLQSNPTEALISIKNLFDNEILPNLTQTNPTYRLVYGAMPNEWYGEENTKFNFDDKKTLNSNYNFIASTPPNTTILNDTEIPDRIAIQKDKYYQTTLLHEDKFKGTFIDSTIGLENLRGSGLNIYSSNGTETIFGTKYSGYSQEEIEEAFSNGTLYFILDDSNTNINFGNLKYNYRPALEYTSNLNLLPRTFKDSNISDSENTWYLEHTDGLKGRNIHAAVIIDLELLIDYDFNSRASINENLTEPNLEETTFNLESIEYKIQDNIPFLLGTINDPSIPNLTNPFINIGSRVAVYTGLEELDTPQSPQKSNLLVNNIYAERVFSGVHTDLSLKDNFNDTINIMKDSKYYKKFYPYDSNTGLGVYENNFRKDFFMLNEEDLSNPITQSPTPKSIISMARLQSDLDYNTDNPTYNIRVKELAQTPIKLDTFKGIIPIASEDYTAGSAYQANLALIQFGGSSAYVTDTSGATAEIMDGYLSFQKIYIKDNPQNVPPIVSGKVPLDTQQVIDGYHLIMGNVNNIRIPTWWDVVLKPSVRPNRTSSLRSVWELIRDNIPLTDNRWLKITDGIIRKPKALSDIKLNGGIHRDYEIVSIPNLSQLFIFGGEGYIPTNNLKRGATVSSSFLTQVDNEGMYYAAALRRAYNNRTTNPGEYRLVTINNPDGSVSTINQWVDLGGWLGRTDILGMDYGWENGEPYVEYAWAEHFYYYYNNTQHSGLKFYVNRISRQRCINTNIYHLDLSNLNGYHPGDNDIYPPFITKVVSNNYLDLFKDPTGVNPDITDYTQAQYNRPNFIDVVYQGTSWWFVIKPAYQANPIICKMEANYNITVSGTGAIFTSFVWDNYNVQHNSIDGLPLLNDTNYQKWSILPDISGFLRGDGPILIKHTELEPLLSGTPTYEPGIYYYDTWNNTINKKANQLASNTIPVTSTIFGVNEVMGIRNPYIIQLDPIKQIEHKIDIIGSRFFIVMYLDLYLANLTKEDFLQFKEEILHINNNVSTFNPQKKITIFNNIKPVSIRTILPDGDNYRSNSAQILMERISTQTGRPASDFVFRLTNRNKNPLEIDSIRFTTI